jgi:hypothetical protein
MGEEHVGECNAQQGGPPGGRAVAASGVKLGAGTCPTGTAAAVNADGTSRYGRAPVCVVITVLHPAPLGGRLAAGEGGCHRAPAAPPAVSPAPAPPAAWQMEGAGPLACTVLAVAARATQQRAAHRLSALPGGTLQAGCRHHTPPHSPSHSTAHSQPSAPVLQQCHRGRRARADTPTAPSSPARQPTMASHRLPLLRTACPSATGNERAAGQTAVSSERVVPPAATHSSHPTAQSS